MIDELLQYSRSRNKELLKEWINVDNMIIHIQELFDRETQERGIKWMIHSIPDMYSDRRMMEKVFLNLISNAVKYTGKQSQPVIEISGEVRGGLFQFSIKDNGAGFDMRYSNKLFAVFQRLHKRSDFEGTGIGLANVQRIIHRHQGQIWAHSQVGQGAEFHFSIPQS